MNIAKPVVRIELESVCSDLSLVVGSCSYGMLVSGLSESIKQVTTIDVALGLTSMGNYYSKY